jgi:hypothetical protein
MYDATPQPPSFGGRRLQSPPSQPYLTTPPRPWYRRVRFMLPIGAVAGFIIGVGAGASGASSAPQALPTDAPTPAVTTTTTAVQTVQSVRTTTATKTVQARKEDRVQGVLDAWTNAGPQPDKQAAAMRRLSKEWPTLARALESATGVKVPPAPSSRTAPPAAPTTGTAPADVYYPNCTAVRAAGAAPLHAGQPGYRPGLDRDGDGVACE